MTVLAEGMRVKDNDRRMPNRIMVVRLIENGYAVLSNDRGTRFTKIRVDRIRTDGKFYKNGWSVVS